MKRDVFNFTFNRDTVCNAFRSLSRGGEERNGVAKSLKDKKYFYQIVLLVGFFDMRKKDVFISSFDKLLRPL